jgi:hypothetical protein
MIQLKITLTGKSFKKNDKYETFATETINFLSLRDAKDFLKAKYGNVKRVPMYRDITGAKPTKEKPNWCSKVGYIYCFRNADYSHSPIEVWLQQDWVEFYELQPMELR